VDASEGLADGVVSRERVDAVFRAAWSLAEPRGDVSSEAKLVSLWAADVDAITAARLAWMGAAAYFGKRAARGKAVRHAEDADHPGRAAEAAYQAALFRDIFGNPFRPPPALDAARLGWNGGTVRKLVEAAYTHRTLPGGTLDNARLGVLADALEDAGGDPELLGHLRGPGQHARGCWVIDLLAGKE
jgi:hypothetical protein